MAETKAEWIRDCEHKASHVVARELATTEELDAVRPRSRSAPLKHWVRYYVALGGFLQRGQLRASLLEHAEADAQTVALLAERPQRLQLAHAPDCTVSIYPKGFDALAWFFQVRDELLGFLVDRCEALRAQERVEHVPLLEAATAELSYQLRLVCWAACTPGPGLPFAFEDERPAIPEPFADLLPVDIRRIHAAFLRINAGNLESVDVLLAPQKPAASRQRPSWSVFWGQLEMRLKVPYDRLTRDRTLGARLAAVKLAAPPPPEDAPSDTKKAEA